MRPFRFSPALPRLPAFTLGDFVILLGLASFLYAGARLALREVTAILRLSRWERWRTLLLPALFPYIVTGAITARGGAWNASIVAEYVQFGGQSQSILGVGALIPQATNNGDFTLLIAGTLTLVSTVVVINRLFWRPLYRIAEAKYHMD